MKVMGPVSMGSFNLIWVLNIMLLQIRQLSSNQGEREGGLVQMKPPHCKNNPEGMFRWEQIGNAIYTEEGNRWKIKSTHVSFKLWNQHSVYCRDGWLFIYEA